MQVLWGIGGMVVLLAIAFGLSTNHRAINPRTVFGALAIQILLVVGVVVGLTRFANFGSIAILIGTFGSISPGHRHEVAQLGIRAVLAGTLANLMNATIAGILIG